MNFHNFIRKFYAEMSIRKEKISIRKEKNSINNSLVLIWENNVSKMKGFFFKVKE